MTIAKAQLIDALRVRYDHYSAEAVFDIARQRVEIEDKAEYSAKEAKSLRAAIELSGDRVGAALAAIDALLGGAGDAGTPERGPSETSGKSDKSDKVEATKSDKSDKVAVASSDKSDKVDAAKSDKSDKPEKSDRSDKVEAAKSDKSDKTKSEVAKSDAAKSDAAKSDAAKSDATKSEAAKSDLKPDGGKAQDVEVVLTGIQVADGEQVLMCGAFDELGDWDPDKARALVKKGDAWLTTVKLQPDTKVAFKFLRRTADGKVTWESGDDRHLTAPRVEATWR